MLYIHQSVLRDLKGAVEQTTDECCGFLFGSDEGKNRIVSTVIVAANDAIDRRSSFRISATNYRRAENFATCNNLQLLGIYHSHPNAPAIPSEFDRAAAQPYFSYVILSVRNSKMEEMRSWNLNTNLQFDEETVAVLNINQYVYGYRNNPYPAA